MTKIVVGTDGSSGSIHAMRWAHHEAALRQEPLHVVLAWSFLSQHYMALDVPFDPGYSEDDAREALTSYVTDAFGDDASVPIHQHTILDLPGRALTEAARHASMLVVGARGRGGFAGLMLGSVSHHCLHHAPCPVVVVHEDDPGAPGADPRIVVAVDGSSGSIEALRWAADEAGRRGATVEAVHCWQLPAVGPYPFMHLDLDPTLYEETAREILRLAVERADAEGAVQQDVLLAGAAPGLLEQAKGADLLVVGSRGHGALRSTLLGSVSLQVSQHAPCPVAVIPPDR
jgi:nucleotide-binding universal stress UspA family protein